MTTARRIAVIGTSGSGKTTLGRAIAARLGVPHVELDALHWRPNWTQAPDEEFRAALRRALEGECWVVDGNYRKVRDLIWQRADTIVWLDYSLSRVMYQLLRRTLIRVLGGEELWNGNRERLRDALFSRDSILLWALQTHHQHRRQYPAAFTQPQHRHLQVIRLHSPTHTRRWLANLSASARSRHEETLSLRQP